METINYGTEFNFHIRAIDIMRVERVEHVLETPGQLPEVNMRHAIFRSPLKTLRKVDELGVVLTLPQLKKCGLS